MESCISRILPKIFEWKRKYASIFYIKIADSEYVFRAITKGEYLTVLNIQSKMDIDAVDVVFEACLLYPKFDKKEFDDKLAGEVETLLNCIIKTSGFSETDRILSDLAEYRNSVSSLENQIILLICKAFPHLTLAEINMLTYEDMMKYLVLAESILDVKLNVEKPTPNKQGKIDFEEENKLMGGKSPFINKPKPLRGDASK